VSGAFHFLSLIVDGALSKCDERFSFVVTFSDILVGFCFLGHVFLLIIILRDEYMELGRKYCFTYLSILCAVSLRVVCLHLLLLYP
jgi:hypothetical protein